MWYLRHGILDMECSFLADAAMEFLGNFQAILFRPQIIFRTQCHKFSIIALKFTILPPKFFIFPQRLYNSPKVLYFSTKVAIILPNFFNFSSKITIVPTISLFFPEGCLTSPKVRYFIRRSL